MAQFHGVWLEQIDGPVTNKVQTLRIGNHGDTMRAARCDGGFNHILGDGALGIVRQNDEARILGRIFE